MIALDTDLFDPRTQMDLAFSRSASVSDGDFGFAFNDSNFSDRILRIEITGAAPDNGADGTGCTSVLEWARRRKRRREDLKKDSGLCLPSVFDICMGPEEIINCNQPGADDNQGCEGEDMDAMPIIEELSSGDEAAEGHEKTWSEGGSPVVRVATVHISSPILAAKSPFFYKLFSNGMRESEQRQVSLRISASEEVAFMELLNFMYSNTLSTNTAPALLDVLMAADKFEVASCMRYCSRMLRNLPMTPESALLYLELPSSVLMASAVQPLTDAAKQYLTSRYRDISKSQEEMMTLPLAAIETILSSNELQAASEDAVYDFTIKWARLHYPELEERREILGSRLSRMLRFPFMTCRKLRKILTCTDFDHEVALRLVIEALFFKSEVPSRQRAAAPDDPNVVNRRFVERVYKYRPVKVVEFESPRQQCIVYLDLKREEIAGLFPGGRVYSQAFFLGGHGLFLSAHCNMEHQTAYHCFGLFLGMQEKVVTNFTVDYEFAGRSKPAEEFACKYKGTYTFTGGKAVGYRNLFGMPWTSFLAEDCPFFINGILHLRAELTLKH